MKVRLGVIGLSFAVALAARGAELPRYQLEPGEVLTYRSNMTAHEQGRSGAGQESGQEGQMRVVVAGQQGDGWNVVVFSNSNYWRGKRPAATTQPSEAEMSIAKEVLHADGRVEPSANMRVDVGGTFVPLPRKEGDLAGYTAEAPFDTTLRITPVERGEKQWVLQVTRESMENVIYMVTQDQKVTIDVDRGLPVRSETSFSQDYGFHEKGTGTNELTGVEKKDAAWAAQLWKEVGTLEEAAGAYGKATENLTGDDAAMKGQLKQAREAFEAAKGKVKSPEVIAAIDRRVEQMKTYEKYEIQEAQDQAKVLNQPAADWTLEKISGGSGGSGGGGGKVSLKELRGKVVVLDWWYRGCGWCMRAMPQVKQVASEYKDRGVVVLGMNVDQKEEDAAFVMEKMGLNYGTMKASWDLAKQYGVHGYPTLVVIDQQGIVRKLHVGYSPDLRKKVGETLDGLLKGG